jgi:hypothetical protein
MNVSDPHSRIYCSFTRRGHRWNDMTAAIERRMNGWSDLPAKLDRLGKSINPAETRVLGNLADEGKPWAWTRRLSLSSLYSAPSSQRLSSGKHN